MDPAVQHAQPPSATRRSPRRIAALIAVACLAMIVGVGSIAGFAYTLPAAIERIQPSGTSSQGDSPKEAPEVPGAEDDSDTPSNSGSTSSAQAKAPSTGVVLIAATVSDGTAAGTGMVLTSDGYILTNYHVIAGSSAIQITVADSQRTYAAEVVGDDASRDVALLKVKGASGLPTVSLDNDDVSIGDAVVALGNANGQRTLVSAAGDVTAMDVSLTVNSDSPWGTTEKLSGMIQTSAAAVPGDSGGPMYDGEGEVLGMTTAGSTDDSVSYAVPIKTATAIVKQIKAGNESGSVRIGPAGYLGVTSDSESTQADGMIISTVDADGPAAAVGIAAGDRLTVFDGTTITASTNVAELIRETEPGQSVKVSWIDSSSGKQRSAVVEMGESPLA